MQNTLGEHEVDRALELLGTLLDRLGTRVRVIAVRDEAQLAALDLGDHDLTNLLTAAVEPGALALGGHDLVAHAVALVNPIDPINLGRGIVMARASAQHAAQ